MTEEEIKALQEAKDAAERRVTELEQSLAAERTEFKTSIDKVVEELKEERRKKNEALGKTSLKEGAGYGPEDIQSLVEETLRKREEEKIKSEFETALAEFKASKPEFQADSAGLVFSKFEDGLKMFNFDDIKSKEQMKGRLEEVYRYINFKPTNTENMEYEGSPSNSNPAPVKADEINPSVRGAIGAAGIDAARAKELQSKYPEAFESLGIS